MLLAEKFLVNNGLVNRKKDRDRNREAMSNTTQKT